MKRPFFMFGGAHTKSKKLCAGFLLLSLNISLGGVIALMPTTVAYAATETLFSDGFESATLANWDKDPSSNNKWSNTASHAHSGSKSAKVTDDTGSGPDYLVLKNSTLPNGTAGYENISVEFYYMVPDEIALDDDWVEVQWRTAGSGSWNSVASTNIHDKPTCANNVTCWKKIGPVTLSGADNKAGFQFRLAAVLQKSHDDHGDEVRIDDLKLTGSAIQEDTLATCTDGTDNDHNGQIDIADAGCVSYRPQLDVVKHVVNDYGGTKAAGDFILSVSSGDHAIAEFHGSEDGTLITSAFTGVSTVREESHDGYASAFSGDCDAHGHVTLNAGAHMTCTVTNTYIPVQTVTVTKLVVGGDKQVADFPLRLCKVGGTPECDSITSGKAISITPGSYHVTEQGAPNYNGTFTDGDCDGSGVLTVSPGQARVCTLTNTFDLCPNIEGNQGSLPSGYTLSDGQCLPVAEPTDLCPNIDGTQGVVPDGYQLVDGQCVLQPNTPPATLMVKITKFLDGTHANSETTSGYSFPMHAEWNATNIDTGSGDYIISTDGWGGSPAYEAWTAPMSVPADYATNEVISDGENGSNVLAPDAACVPGKYRLVGYTWGASAEAASAMTPTSIAPSFTGLTQDEYVNIYNESCPPAVVTTGTVTVTKVVVGGEKGVADFPLHLGTTAVVSGVATVVDAGTYSVSETNTDENYTATFSGDCTAVIEGSGYQITVGDGQEKSCTITNTYQAGDNNPPNETPVTPNGPSGGSTTFDYWGCTDPSADNFNRLANKDDGSCKLPEGNAGAEQSGTTTATSTDEAQGEVLGAATTTEDELPLPASCAAHPYLSDYLKFGRHNDPEQVKLLQQFLNDHMHANLPTSGFFGSLTRTWVKKLQQAYHAEILQPWVDAGFTGRDIQSGTGYVYKTTKRYINMVECAATDIPMPELTPDSGQ